MKRYYLGFLLSFWIVLMYGQQEESHNSVLLDFLVQKPYNELEHNFNEVRYNFAKAEIYAKAYLKKSKIDKDVVRQADAYYFLSFINKPAISEQYADSIILLTKDIKNDTYPARGFLAKALALQQMGKYKEAFDQLLAILEYENTNNNDLQQMEVKYLIGVIRAGLGEDKKALDNFRAYLHKIEGRDKKDKNYAYNYSKALFAIGVCYNQNKKYDSATIVNKKGFEFALKNTEALKAEHFTLSMGITAYLEKNHSALESLQKAEKVLSTTHDTKNLMRCYLYMGKVYRDQGRVNDAILYFKKVDSISKKTSTIFPFMKEAYICLNYYHEKGELTLSKAEGRRIGGRLNYLNYLDDLRSYRIDFKDIRLDIVEKYDIPQLTSEKAKEIEDLTNDKIAFRIWIISLSIIVLFISAFAYYYYRKQQMYRLRFKTLLDEKKAEKQPSTKTEAATVEGLNISETALNNIIEKLKLFIDEKQFLSNDISLNDLAKAMDTNPNYLSRFINFHEQKNFSAYIKELRISYAVEELKTNAVFRKYSIKAIAEEVGFNNEQSFSKAFYKKTGIYPSYFIKELEKELFRKQSA